MDKDWMKLHRNSDGYRLGLEGFLNFAFEHSSSSGTILCPCKNCSNNQWQNRAECRVHLICDGFLKNYTYWILHGEEPAPENTTQCTGAHDLGFVGEQRTSGGDMQGLLNDVFGINDEFPQNDISVESGEGVYVAEGSEREVPPREKNKDRLIDYMNLIGDAEKELYPGCSEFSKLSFLVHLMHIKCMKGWDKESFEMVLQLCIRLHPDIDLPKTYYECQKIINKLGLGYKKIPVCPNDCMIYWGEREEQETCHVCGKSRWKNGTNSENDEDQSETSSGAKRRKVPAKVLRYFPLIPRLQRLFMSRQTADDMRWHAESRVNDGLLRHPADGEAWKAFDARYPEFAAEVHNVRLGLSSDGFNPYRTRTSNYSTWPVVLVPYNLPPWIGMKQSSFILSMIIPGKKSPGNDIDVFLQALIEELNQLWEGVETYDASKQENFKMQAALMWTISDFPAYAMLSGWSTKGRYACPNCADHTRSKWLKNGKKFCYMGHRRWLPEGHPHRWQTEEFDNTEEHELAPTYQTGESILEKLKDELFTFGKKKKKKKRKQATTTTTKKMQKMRASAARKKQQNQRGQGKRPRATTGKRKQATVKRKPRRKRPAQEPEKTDPIKCWKKKSIFFDLPYWKYHLLRHNLDVMHIEKNVCDKLIAMLLNMKKSKDNLKARLRRNGHQACIAPYTSSKW